MCIQLPLSHGFHVRICLAFGHIPPAACTFQNPIRLNWPALPFPSSPPSGPGRMAKLASESVAPISPRGCWRSVDSPGGSEAPIWLLLLGEARGDGTAPVATKQRRAEAKAQTAAKGSLPLPSRLPPVSPRPRPSRRSGHQFAAVPGGLPPAAKLRAKSDALARQQRAGLWPSRGNK